MAAVEALSVWPVAQQVAREQRRGRYLPESNAHPGKMLPALASEAIRRYTRPGELVLDPMCGIGTTLVEAAHLDRAALGVELEPRWASLAAANIRHAEHNGATGSAIALRGDARRLGSGLLESGRRAIRTHAALTRSSSTRPHASHATSSARSPTRGSSLVPASKSSTRLRPATRPARKEDSSDTSFRP